MAEDKPIEVTNNPETRIYHKSKCENRIRISNSKESCSHRKRSSEAFQLMREHKSIEVMNNRPNPDLPTGEIGEPVSNVKLGSPLQPPKQSGESVLIHGGTAIG
jgi:hypothetical protein